MTQTQTRGNSSDTKTTDYDAIVIGTGFGGIYSLYKLRNELGLSVRAFDKAGGVGGTWYWNRYPGALSDTESYVYRYSFDKELLQEWEWDTRYLQQPQILAYLGHVVERYDLARDIQFNTGITGILYDDASGRWTLKTDTGETFTARFVVTALGLLSRTNIPDIKGIETFAGDMVHTGAWPDQHDFSGKRVGVIGTGSTGIQVITAIRDEVDHLTVFQRSPQYCVPVGNGPVTPEYVDSVKSDYDQIWEHVRNSVVAFGFEESDVPAMSVSEEERQRVFEKNWNEGGGFRFMFATFSDIATDEEANKAAQDFIKGKIAEAVNDPETARKLMPTDYYAKRPLCGTDYYDTYNREHVELVALKENPIDEITPKGIRTADGVEHEIDVLILATGFDAVDGNYTKLDIRGRGGVTLNDHWNAGPTSFLGTTISQFPNLFMILGPNGPFTNLPPSIETQVEWISDLVKHVKDREGVTVEPTKDAEDGWTKTCQEIADMTLFPKADSWIFGANIPGKKNTVMFYMAGLAAYREQLAEVTDNGYRGFDIKTPAGADK
ncbi:cation diffusion facilitator CzcD-associated flavoprotein CzcO [Antricoccus suffuscus]|uniref:Cation diffusion facilitator CzcD-associated flavoprotein CzcO n=1 Tax=Antricoccus suffuscus TaxID=1629062 RepID=A0A2T0ZZD5_9ACTN|nr:NAD(P)/FAD-dependent oxidoreductase [Antricoccus suffuscus]PRZ41715.1 cation diffusion facilitator CzcD-associated flavoprotein CzcO [Antricoccus suffuscus]